MADDNKVPNGPENIPLRNYISNFPIVVTIKDLSSGRLIREEKVDYSDKEVRMWLGRVTVWACENKYSVITCAEKDYVVI